MTILLDEIVQSLELWLKMIRKPQPYVDPNLDPVLLVPGIAGSVLNAVDEETGKEERVWVRILGADYAFRTKLWSRFDPATGKTESLDPKTKIVVPEDRYGLHAIDALDPDLVFGQEAVYYFHDMIVEFIKWGYQEGKTLFGFGYDFRQSNRLKETLDRLAAKLEEIYNASGGKKINIISHSMGGLLVKCFMCLHSDVFEKYVKNWIAIAAPFQGAPGYVTSTFLNGMSFVDGWESNFFISKWSFHQLLIECPSIYELMACLDFQWEHKPLLEMWRERLHADGNSQMILESYPLAESVDIFKGALANNTFNYNGEDIPLPYNMEILRWANETRDILSRAKVPPQVKFYNIYGVNLETPHTVCYGDEQTPVTDLQQLRYFQVIYLLLWVLLMHLVDFTRRLIFSNPNIFLPYQPRYVCVDGDGTVPAESAMADGLRAEARVGVPGEHRGILCEHHVFRILKHWLKADHDPYYNPLNDYVVLPTAFEMEKHKEKGFEVTSLKEEWEIITDNRDDNRKNIAADGNPMVSSISVSQEGAEACATVTVYPQNEGKQHVELNAVSVSVDA
uniref:lecithin-cholesterol acyltransferase-like 4 isoform X1 n=1 Tax=Fragaria vesca subsp. vesca TaxID=101020 RepID=UPI0005CB187E|nr:PREDICTED: lecithin-cholesterol acyltransferase-like 4 isoform X1 [Fragaria vesca subsp. vesca]